MIIKADINDINGPCEKKSVNSVFYDFNIQANYL